VESGERTAVAVFGILLEESGKDNQRLGFLDLLRPMAHSRSPRTTTLIHKGINFRKLFPKDIRNYFRYRGGVTTPHCEEVAVWTVFKKPMRISTRQLEILWDVFPQGGQFPLENTWRPLQPLNSRNVVSFTN
jgi:carbonic anhydrase